MIDQYGKKNIINFIMSLKPIFRLMELMVLEHSESLADRKKDSPTVEARILLFILLSLLQDDVEPP